MSRLIKSCPILILITLLLALILTSPGHAASERTILFLGDSLTDGDGVQKEFAFPALVEQRMEGFHTINQGRSGWATSSYLRRWYEVQSKLPETVDAIFIQLGANDLRVDGHSDATVSLCRINMEEILLRLERIFPQAEIVLMSSTKLDPGKMTDRFREAGFGKHSNAFIDQIGQAYRTLADEKGYGFIDLHNSIPMPDTLDGAHLTKEGHESVAVEIIKFLEDGEAKPGF